MNYEKSTSSYGKRPLWQWVVLYLVIGGLVYFAVYYFLFQKNTYQAPQAVSTTKSPAPTSFSNSSEEIFIVKTDPAKGPYLADSRGMALYIFDKDTSGVSNCNNTCTGLWPPFMPSVSPPPTLPVNVTEITRADGSRQYAYKNKPLYYYSQDTAPGDTKGDGVGGLWHLLQP